MRTTLPPGQRAIDGFPRFGLPSSAAWWPEIPPRPSLKLGGDVEIPCEVALEELSTLERVEQESDLHCVTTWSRCGLRWSGYRFRDVYERILLPRARPHSDARYVVFKGMDHHRACLALEDALAPNVLLADRLDGEELSVKHGAPIRLVVPAHYGYKSVKHLNAIVLARDFRGAGWKEHPRGRVELEERGQFLPGWALRRLYRPLIGPTLGFYRRAARRRERGRPR